MAGLSSNANQAHKHMPTTNHLAPSGGALACALFVSTHVFAQGASTSRPIEEVVVIGDAIDDLDLNSETETGSRLGLTVMETPATVEPIDCPDLGAYRPAAGSARVRYGSKSEDLPLAFQRLA